MEESDWKLLTDELTRTAGALRVAALLKQSYGNTVEVLLREFDRVATDEQKAAQFVANLLSNWWAVRGPNSEYKPVGIKDWEKVVAHIQARYPKVPAPKYFDSKAHESHLAGQDPNGKRFD